MLIRETDEEKLSAAIGEFTDSYSRDENEAALWLWLKTAVSGNFDQLSQIEKENMFTYYEQLGNLLDALYPQELPEEQN